METALYSEMAKVEGEHWWFRGRRAVILDVLRRHARPGGVLLDVGLGTGFNAALFKKMGFAVEGIESAPEAVAIARRLAPDVRIVEPIFPSATLPPEKYSVIAMLDVLEHLENDAEALRCVARVLKPGGVVLITVPAFMFLWTRHDELAHHYRRYRRGELTAKLRAAGLEPQLLSYYNFFLFPAVVFVRLVTKALGKQKEGSDFDATPGFLNAPLAWLFGFERFLLRFASLPFGVSLIAVARKLP